MDVVPPYTEKEFNDVVENVKIMLGLEHDEKFVYESGKKQDDNGFASGSCQNNSGTCNICTLPYTKFYRRRYQCPKCNYGLCSKCLLIYLENQADFKCVNPSCDGVYEHGLLLDFFYPAERKCLESNRGHQLMEVEKSKIPNTAPYAERFKQLNSTKTRIKDLEEILQAINDQSLCLKERINRVIADPRHNVMTTANFGSLASFESKRILSLNKNFFGYYGICDRQGCNGLVISETRVVIPDNITNNDGPSPGPFTTQTWGVSGGDEPDTFTPTPQPLNAKEFIGNTPQKARYGTWTQVLPDLLCTGCGLKPLQNHRRVLSVKCCLGCACIYPFVKRVESVGTEETLTICPTCLKISPCSGSSELLFQLENATNMLPQSHVYIFEYNALFEKMSGTLFNLCTQVCSMSDSGLSALRQLTVYTRSFTQGEYDLLNDISFVKDNEFNSYVREIQSLMSYVFANKVDITQYSSVDETHNVRYCLEELIYKLFGPTETCALFIKYMDKMYSLFKVFLLLVKDSECFHLKDFYQYDHVLSFSWLVWFINKKNGIKTSKNRSFSKKDIIKVYLKLKHYKELVCLTQQYMFCVLYNTLWFRANIMLSQGCYRFYTEFEKVPLGEKKFSATYGARFNYYDTDVTIKLRKESFFCHQSIHRKSLGSDTEFYKNVLNEVNLYFNMVDHKICDLNSRYQVSCRNGFKLVFMEHI